MGVKNTAFFLDLKTLDKKGDEKLKDFAKKEDLEVKDIIKIIYNEANRIDEKDKVKVTFKVIDDDDDTFRIIVEHANIKYKGTIIYPFEGIKSKDFELSLDSVFGKITLYNKKEDCDKITVTIDGVSLDIFSMTYKKAKEYLKDICDRKEKGGYIEFPDAICFKRYGVKINSQKDDNADIKVDAPVASIDVYNKEEFFKEYYFEEKEEQKYDVNIPLPDEYNYEKNKRKPKNIKVENSSDSNINEDIEIEIELPQEEAKPKVELAEQIEKKEEINEVDKRQAELDMIKAKQDAELERVKEKLKRELEEQLNDSIKKYDEQNEKRIKEENKEIVKETKADSLDTIDKKDDDEINEIAKKLEVEDEEEQKQEEIQTQIVENTDAVKEENKFETIDTSYEEKKEDKEKIDIQNTLEESKYEKEIKELERLLEEEKKQQEMLENRIIAKLEELKEIATKKAEPKVEVKDINEPVKVTVPTGYLSYEIESYKGIKEQGKDKLDIYFGQSKQDIRNYFGGSPKEIRDYDEMEMYDIFYAYYDEDDRCTGIGIYNQEVYKDKIALYMFGHNLITMTYREIVKLIKKNDYNAIEDDDGIISLKYGISVDPRETSNYKDEISEVIHIFKKGYYDEVYENF